MRIAASVFFLLALWGCKDSDPGLFVDLGAGDALFVGDGGARDIGRGLDAAPSRCPQKPCMSGRVCRLGICVETLGPCQGDDDCFGDSYCDQGQCVAYGAKTKPHDPTCVDVGFAPEQLEAPTVKCRWTGADTLSTPVVIDLDGDKKPEILFVAFKSSSFPTTPSDAGTLVAIRGDTCQELWRNDTARLHNGAHLAAADLDGDGVPEIVGVNTSDRVVVLSNTGQLIITSDQGARLPYTNYGIAAFGSVAIANLDNQGAPEIVYGGMALRYTNRRLDTLYNHQLEGGYWGLLSAVADVDLDGKPEVIVGNRIRDAISGADKTPPGISNLPGGYVAVGQFDRTTSEPEIVLVSSQERQAGSIRIFNPKTGKVIFGPYTFGERYGGPPTVADFDGDGEPEVGAAGYSAYAVFDMECAETPRPGFCEGPGVRWSRTTRDRTSGSTGSSVFDFNGDGRAEVVYRDECWLRVYEGRTGKVLFAHGITNGTATEIAVIADTDGDQHADIVVNAMELQRGLPSCGAESELGTAHPGNTKGVYVLSDPKNRWMKSRTIWNQHTYHITNINDDGTVPLKEINNWDGWNNYRQNTQGMLPAPEPLPDLTAAYHPELENRSDCVTQWVLAATICNRGGVTVAVGVKGTHYAGDPRKGGTPLCTSETTRALAPGECEVTECTYPNPPSGIVQLWFAADDDGHGKGAQRECKEANNLIDLGERKCNKKVE